MTPQGGGPSIDLSFSQFNQEKLWKVEILLIETPKQLMRILLFLMVEKFLGPRGGYQHWNLEWEKDISYIQGTEIGKANVYL